MSKKYRELPAYEVNEFKVGDRVRIYGFRALESFEEIVTGIHGPVLEFNNGSDIGGAHFKQCRKLEEVKPREFTIYIDDLGNIYPANERHRSVSCGAVRPLKVREVLEDE